MSTDECTGTAVVGCGVRIAYRLDGPAGAPALVLANSLGTTLRLWDAQVPRFAARYRLVRYDMRGHGQSDVPAGPYSLEQLGGDLLALLDALDIAEASICGLSLGGLVGQWVAVEHPARVRSLILANTAARIGSVASWDERIAAVHTGGMAAIRDAAVARFLSEGFRRAHPAETRAVAAMLESTPPEGYVAACGALREADLRAVVGNIRARTLVLGGTRDESTPTAQARALAAAIPNSELTIFAGAAHLSNVEMGDTFTSRVLAFLDA